MDKRGLAAGPLRLASRIIAPVARLTAVSGIGSEEWMRHGVLPVAAHYYQPVFDAAALPADVWERAHPMPGVELGLEPQRALLQELAPFAAEPCWPEYGVNGTDYYWRNGTFGYSSAIVLYTVVRRFRPTRVIEVGAGMSTLVLSQALARNGTGRLVTIEPHPGQAPASLDLDGAELVPLEVQRVPVAEFEELAENDLLFIDSSHVVRTAGDVNYLYLDVLPRLRSGVIVHIHDIQLPYEYPRRWLTQNDAPRRFWTEQYMVQALLQENPRWQIMLAAYLWQKDHPKEFRAAFPDWDPQRHKLTSSFYIRRT